jgi:hypothetical protein
LKNEKVKITYNPFDYTFKCFVINKDYLEQNRKVEILYDDQIIGTFNVDYANVIQFSSISIIITLKRS